MIDSLPTDADSPLCGAGGCAEGSYFMDLNVAFAGMLFRKL
jgi:hypothetical protein